MKSKVPMLAIVALFGAALALTFAGCAEQPEVTSETVEEVDEAAEEMLLQNQEEPGERVEPGVDAEEMADEEPPPPALEEEEQQEEPQGPTEAGVESDELDPIETGPTGGGVDVDEMTEETPPHVEGTEEGN